MKGTRQSSTSARLVVVMCVALAVSQWLTPLARAQPAPDEEEDGNSLLWDPDWPRFRTAEYVTVGALAVGILVVLLVPGPDEPNFEGGILFDEALRDVLVISSRDGRGRAAKASDILYYSALAYPFLIDNLFAMLLIRGSPDVAFQTFMMNIEGFGASGFFSLLGQRHLGRGRPFLEGCRTDPNYTGCNSVEATRSFPSGHTAIAFNSAGLTCAHHLNLELYGGGWPDYLTCGLWLGIATSVGVLRMSADRHWSTDTLVGIGLGLFTGYGLPMLLHYRHGDSGGASDDTFDAALVPITSPDGDYGLSFVGRF